MVEAETPGRGPRLKVNDANMMRALAHPARLAIIERLMTGAEMTATECAEFCGLSPSATSYHLRALAKFGIIDEARNRGDARERVWRSSYGGMSFETVGDADLAGADVALAEAVMAHEERVSREFLRRSDELPKEWQEGAGLLHTRLELTAGEAKDLLREVTDLLDRYRAGDSGPRAGATRALVMFRLFPELRSLVREAPLAGPPPEPSQTPPRGRSRRRAG